MKKISHLILLTLVASFILPNIVFASWWNPFSWNFLSILSLFNKSPKIEILQIATTTSPTSSANQTQIINDTDIPQTNVLNNSTANWKTYRNEKYGFEFKYPSDFKITSEGTDDYFLSNPQSGICQIVYKIELTKTSLSKMVWEAGVEGRTPVINVQVQNPDCDSILKTKMILPPKVVKITNELKNLKIPQSKMYMEMFKGISWINENSTGDLSCKDISIITANNNYIIKNLECFTGPIYPETISSIIPLKKEFLIRFEDEASVYQKDGSFDQILSTFKFI